MTRSTTALLGILVLVVMAQSVAGEPVSRMEVSEVKPLLIRAIDQGAAHGVLVGVGAEYMRRKFDAGAPIEIDVRSLHDLPQSGCSRLEVTTHQKDVLEQGKRTDKALTYQVSFCRNGRFPEKR